MQILFMKKGYNPTTNVNINPIKTHVESIHKEMLYPCDQCEYKYANKDKLKTHIASDHKENIEK